MSKQNQIFLTIVFFSFNFWWVLFVVITLEWDFREWSWYTFLTYLVLSLITTIVWNEEEKRNWGK